MLTSNRYEFLNGVKDEIPILLGVIPFGLIFGAGAVASHLPVIAAQAMSSVIFAGSAQFIVAQLLGAGASGLVVLMVIFVVNLRHALYSASLAPYMQHLKPSWKLLLAYLLTDEAYAVAVTHYQRGSETPNKHWYFLGAGLTLWTSWQISTALGIFIGTKIPSNLPLSFFLPLTFIALVIPVLKDRASLVSALVAGLMGLLTINFPYKTGLLIAGLSGILAGLAIESRKK